MLQVHKEVGVRRKAYWCVKEWSKPWFSHIYELGMFWLIFVSPVVIMSFAYASICMELWVMTRKRQMMQAGK